MLQVFTHKLLKRLWAWFIIRIKLTLRRTHVCSYSNSTIINHTAARCINNYRFKDILQHI